MVNIMPLEYVKYEHTFVLLTGSSSWPALNHIIFQYVEYHKTER